MKTMLEQNIQEHINYIIEVNKELNTLKDAQKTKEELNSLPIARIYELSKLSEQVYQEHLHVKALENALEEIKEIGIVAFKEKHGLK